MARRAEADGARAPRRWQDLAEAEVGPHAQAIDREAHIPDGVIAALRRAGAFASGFPEALGGPAGSDSEAVAAALDHGEMHEALGAASASVQGLVNVHHMAGSALVRWGSPEQKGRWGSELTSGRTLAALAITEPDVGSDIAAVATRAERVDGGWRIDGRKRWITCGQSADLFVLLAASEQGPTTFLLPRPTPGLTIIPIENMLGCRGYMLAELQIEDCRVGDDHLLGRPGFGASLVAATALDSGRFNLAWGCVGLGQACLDASLAYTQRRRQFDSPLSDFQLVQRMITRMMTDVHAARLMCRDAAVRRGRRDPDSVRLAAMAKYFASTMANRVASDALQLHGANGCGPEFPLERWFRDARIMEIIEGTSQVLEGLIARYGYQGDGW